MEKINSGDKVDKVYYRVVENLFQNILPIHGVGLDQYDSRIVKKRITSKAKAEALAEKLQAETDKRKLSHQLRYLVEAYTSSRSKELSKSIQH